MDRIKRRTNSASTSEEAELSLIKAAAWAWYQHGSGNNHDSKPIREPDVARTRPAPRPSRYKLEALHADPNPMTNHLEPENPNSLLLDLYEIERITRELDRIIGSDGKDSGSRMRVREGKRAEKKINGFWVRQAVGFCGSTCDAVDAVGAAALAGRRRGK